VTRLRAALPTAVLAVALALTGCEQPTEANDNGPEADPAQPGGVIRTPESVEDAPTTVPLPGESNSPNVSGESAEPEPSSS
jgi:hypothetical protein